MRRNHLVGILLLSLLTWVFIIYVLLRNRPTSGFVVSPDDGFSLIQLETNIKEEQKANALLMRNVKNAVHEQIEARRIEEEEKAAAIEETRKEDERRLQGTAGDGVVAVLVFACNRPTVTRCLEQLIRYRPSPSQFPIIVSQDCEHEGTAQAISAFSSQVFHIKQPDQREIFVPPKEKKFKGYFKIARHYGWALNQTFNVYNFTTAIIIEDDLDVSPDLFSYFLATLPLLKHDPSLWCVSAWNDNGKLELIDTSSPELLHRTDFFPGLGWMITKSLWSELSPKWPLSYWDDWIRQPEQRKGRACIRPEVSRTRTFGKIGVSNGLFYEKHLKYIHLNDKYVPFTKLNLTYLLKDNYDSNFVKTVYESPIVSHQELRSGNIVQNGPVRIAYNTKTAYRSAAKTLGLMDDFRSGVPRTGYRGVVSFFYKGRRVYLAPPARWKGYDPSWS
ncbi:alpha-1,3-mannosyl-glycoprotein 2-beta-N-acetylglucosaminyltransferase [Halyomorpha halys]|uniref:alpha-1,3-mannosyl-glycoprotein 2-beta-N-acetylglucosaminyltransferase n=1 Tax=Halyomorpha halys TaxID=286706 RepID=UPI0006D4DC66|nr:alpha-1,3-mannosyl-glycoprotein 2-beta-N-acetylglucosaminyltransferase [Halyomorpha halys]XP_024216448.1 alpha-1,3-mannosyl-glycoprotein 2-beta-N-acetylglucosaminyltransferase [Halyomorpha halys]XP_024216451.1 alpha-1,3-mannosyl-glycoprotein 2-beta-N-acetylglucosaminyltransferase [Halyomorpha halys]